MCKKIWQIILTCAMATILTASAETPEIFQNAKTFCDTTCNNENTEVSYTETESEEEDQEPIDTNISEMKEISDIVPEKNENIQKLEESLNSINTMLDQITSTYSEENVEIEGKIAEMLEEIREVIEQQPESLEDIQEQYDIAKARLEQYVQMLQSIKDKMATIKISSSTDISQPFGFTEEEFIYILRNVRGRKGNLIIKDTEMAEKVARGIIEAISEYPVNELFAVSVMSFETGYFTSVLVIKYSNFGGMQRRDAEGAYHFGTPEEGIVAAVKCIHSNLRKNNTPNDVNEKYCSPHIETIINEDGEEEEVVDVYYWARNVVSIMKSYARGIAKFN